jgi:DNA gyrase subunit A
MQDNNEEEINQVEKVDIINSAEKCFLNYSMSVISDRALPDIRDGLKPVHRRILWSQFELGNKPNAAYKKCARIIGDVIGKYHPHGDNSVYDALVRMAQDFSMRAELVDGQGNFGSVDGDNPAAMRYTEARMTTFANSMFEDMPYNTVNMVPNYDGQEFMPEVLPLKYPNLLVNGSHGIAVGMACNVPPHNPIEVLNCVEHIIKTRLTNEELDLQDLIKLMPSPDFPTGGLVHNLKQMEEVWSTGRGSVRLRAKWFEEESPTGNPVIIINEIPYQVNKEKLILHIHDLAKPNKNKGGKIEIEEIKAFRDESDKDGMRIYIELKKDVEPELFFNKLISMTDLEKSVSYNINVLINGKPKLVGIMDVFEHFINHRLQVITRRTEYLDNAAAKKEHILKGLAKALAEIDKVIELVKSSKSTAEAKVKLQDYLDIDEVQSQSIVDMKLQKLTSGEISEIEAELFEIQEKRKAFKNILESEDRRYQIILEESDKQISMFANGKRAGERVYGKRLTDFEYNRLDTDLAALTKEEDCTILFTNNGYLRRVPVTDFENQNRGTRGKKFMKLKDKDFIVKAINSHSHDIIMLVTEKGKVYSLNAYELTDSLSGRHINNILQIDKDDKVLVISPVSYTKNEDIVMVTESGMVKKTKLSEYSNSFRKSGLLGIKLKEGDKIISAETCTDSDKVMLVNDKNNIIIFEAIKLASLKRKTQGVKGMNISEGKLIGAGIVVQEGLIVTISSNGMIKITRADEYKTQKRGGKGVKVFKDNEKTGMLFKAISISDLNQDIITTTKKGVSNRISLESINVTRRTTSGVKLMKLDNKDSLADSFIVSKSEDVESFEGDIEEFEETSLNESEENNYLAEDDNQSEELEE